MKQKIKVGSAKFSNFSTHATSNSANLRRSMPTVDVLWEICKDA